MSVDEPKMEWNHSREDLVRENSGSRRSTTVKSILLMLTGALILCGTLHAQLPASLQPPPPLNQGLLLKVGAWMEIPDNPTLVLDTFTVECWVKATSRFVIVSRDRPGNARPDWSVVFEAPNQRIEFMTGMNSQPDSYFWTPIGSFPHSVWNHLALVVNGPAGTTRCYINGALSGSFTFAPRNFTVMSGLAWGGYFRNALGATGTGRIDECRYWRGERARDQILTLMNTSAIDLAGLPNLMGFWRFCGNYDDETINANHGQPMGSPPIVDIPDLPMGITCGALELRVIVPSVRPICPGESIQLLVQAMGGRPPYQYEWSPTQYLLDPYTDSPRATPPKTTLFSVTVYDADGRQATGTVLVEVFPEIQVDAGPDLEFCGVQDFFLHCNVISGQAPLKFAWEPHPTIPESERFKQNPKVTPTLSGTYTYVVYIEDMAGCLDYDSVTVHIYDDIQVDAGPDQWYCGLRDIRLSPTVTGGTAPILYEWSPDSLMDLTDPAAPIVHPERPSVYRLRVTDANGCTAADSVEIRAYGALELEISGENVLCKPGTVTLRCSVLSGKFPFRSHWSPSGFCSTPDELETDVFVDSTTTFTIRVIDANGCAAEIAYTVMIRTGPTVILPPNLSACRGDTLELQGRVAGGSQPFTVQWEPAAFVSDDNSLTTRVSADSTRMFILSVIDANGCAGEDSVLVVVSDGPVVSTGPDIILCRGDSTRLHVATSGGVPPYTFEWRPPIGFLSGIRDADPIVRPDYSIIYIVRVTDAAGCSREDNVQITVMDNARVELRPPGVHEFCDGDSLLLEASTGYARYEWYRDGVLLPDTGSSLYARSAGKYNVRAWTSGNCGAISPPVYVRLLLAPRPVILIIGQEPFCEGDSVTLKTERSYLGYRWVDENGAVVSRDAIVRIGSMVRLRVVVTDTGSCAGISDEVIITAIAPPAAEILGPRVLCRGESALYTVALLPGDTCTWQVQGGNIVSTAPLGTLTVQWTTDSIGSIRATCRRPLDGNGKWCAAQDEIPVIISEIPQPLLILQGDSLICEGDVRLLRTQPGFANYEWHTPAGSIFGSDTLTVSSSGTYYVVVTSAEGCSGTSAPVTLAALPSPSVYIEGPSVLCPDASAIYHAIVDTGTTLRWVITGGVAESGLSEDSVLIRWPSSGLHVLLVTADNGSCRKTDTLLVSVADSVRMRISPEGTVRLCEGDSVLLDAGSGYQSYEWQTPAGSCVTQSIQARAAGMYSVRVVSRDGCVGLSDPVLLDIHETVPPVISGPTELCAGDSLVLTTEPGFAAYHWSNGDAGMNSTIVTEGTYYVSVVDSFGCTAVSDEYHVRMFPAPEVPVILRSIDSLHCSPAVRYQWYVDGVIISDSDRRAIPITKPGNYRVNTFDENGCPATSDVFIIDRIFDAFTLVGLPMIEAAPGDIIQLPLSLLYESNLSLAAPAQFNTVLSFDETILVPIRSTPQGSTENGRRKIVLQHEGYDGGDILSNMEFLVTLGTAVETPLTIEQFDWDGSPVRVETRNGLLRVKICREGGDRLFDGSHRFGLEQNTPNPAAGHTTIRYSLLTAGPVRLVLTDIHGRNIKTLVDAVMDAGDYQADVEVSRLASGTYRLQLESAAGTRQRLMVIAH